MSVFDPHSLYIHSNRKTRKGQIIQKRAVDNDYAFNQKDLERALRILTAYGYYFSPSPPLQPLAKTLSFNISRLFSDDQVLKLSEVVNSVLRAHVLGIDPDFFDSDPSDVKHFYFFLSLTNIYGTLTSGSSLRLRLSNGVDSTVSFSNNARSMISIYPSSLYQFVVVHSPTTTNASEVDYIDDLNLENLALVTIALDYPDLYSMLYSNDFSQLPDQDLATITLSTGYLGAFLNISMTYVNFD